MAAHPLRLRDPLLVVGAVAALAAAAWLVWLTVLAQGCWGAPPQARCERVDFAAFWGAGRLAASGRAADVYRWPALREALEGAFSVPVVRPLPFLYPPSFLLVTTALGRLPYGAAFWAWTALGLAAYAWAVLRIVPRPLALAVALAPAGVFTCAFSGQNGFLTAAALAGGLVLLDRRPVAAGLLFAVLAFKPQLAVLVPVALAADRRWRTLAAMAGGVAVACLLAAGAFGPDVFLAFVSGAGEGGGTFAGGGWLPWWKVQSLYGMLRGAEVGASVALAAQGGLAVILAAGVWCVWRSDTRTELKAAALASAALLATPYAFIYDGTLLACAALFLLRDGESAGGLSPAQALLCVFGLLAPAAFMVWPASAFDPAAASALLLAAGLRAAGTPAQDMRVPLRR